MSVPKLKSIKYQRSVHVAATLLIPVLITAILYFAQPVLIPMAIAVLLTFMLAPLVNYLTARGISRTPAALMVVAASGLILLGLCWLLYQQVDNLVRVVEENKDRIARRVNEFQHLGQGGVVERLQKTADEVIPEEVKPEAATPDGTQEKPIVVSVTKEEASFTESLTASHLIPAVLHSALEPLEIGLIVVLLATYMLIKLPDMRARLLRVSGHGRITITTKAMDDASQRISRYLLMQFCINLSFGLGIAIALWLVDLPYAFLWGFLGLILRYIPYVGAALAALLPLTMSLIVQDGWVMPLTVLGIVLTLELIAGSVLEPLLYGKGVGLSEVTIIAALTFWTWLWGPIGLILATPMTTCLFVLCKYVPQLEFMVVLLGDEPALSQRINFYQRLLAQDSDEAMEIVRKRIQSGGGLPDAFDSLVVPTLCYVKRDWRRRLLTDDDRAEVIEGIDDLIEEMEDEEAGIKGGHRPSKDCPQEGERVEVLGLPAKDEMDEKALRLLDHLVDAERCVMQVASASLLANERVALAETNQPKVIIISAVPPGGLTHVTYLLKRLKQRLPQAKVVVGRWGVEIDPEDKTLTDAGADLVLSKLEEARVRILEYLEIAGVSLASTTKPEATKVEQAKREALANAEKAALAKSGHKADRVKS